MVQLVDKIKFSLNPRFLWIFLVPLAISSGAFAKEAIKEAPSSLESNVLLKMIGNFETKGNRFIKIGTPSIVSTGHSKISGGPDKIEEESSCQIQADKKQKASSLTTIRFDEKSKKYTMDFDGPLLPQLDIKAKLTGKYDAAKGNLVFKGTYTDKNADIAKKKKNIIKVKIKNPLGKRNRKQSREFWIANKGRAKKVLVLKYKRDQDDQEMLDHKGNPSL